METTSVVWPEKFEQQLRCLWGDDLPLFVSSDHQIVLWYELGKWSRKFWLFCVPGRHGSKQEIWLAFVAESLLSLCTGGCQCQVAAHVRWQLAAGRPICDRARALVSSGLECSVCLCLFCKMGTLLYILILRVLEG